MPRPRRALWLLAAATACTGSGKIPDDELGSLVHAAADDPVKLDAAKAATDPALLARAVALPPRLLAPAIGPHTVTSHSRVLVHEGGRQVEELVTDTTIAQQADGYHATLTNSADYGREVVFAGGQLYLRPRYGRWHLRPPNDDREPDQILDELGGELAGNFDLVGFAVAASDGGSATVAGRPARVVELGLSKAPRPPAQPLAQRKWRESIAVESLTGSITLDGATAQPLAGELHGKLAFTRDGRRFTMTFDVDHKVEVGAVPPLAVPPASETVATHERAREVDERDQLLKGLAPATGPAPAKGETP